MSRNKSRRKFLKAGLIGSAGVIAGSGAFGSEKVITELQEWNQQLGDGVDVKPYGSPSKFQKHVKRILNDRNNVIKELQKEYEKNFPILENVNDKIAQYICENIN